jgi:putative glycosyltransferase (TIGR04348 family)
MRICLVTPAPPRSYHGNRVTAVRWATILRQLGHSVQVGESYDREPADLLVALHARKSAAAIRRARATRERMPVVLALTGTDLYPDLGTAGVEPDVLTAADRLLVLQPLGIDQLPLELRDRARVIYQSALAPSAAQPAGDAFDVALLAHLRPVKDPLLPARAARLLPGSSQVRIRHAGAVIDAALGDRATAEDRDNPRYDWLGALSRGEAGELLASSRLLVHPSRQEGGANVASEALAAGVPIVATRIPGTVGILGSGYPGYFPPGDEHALAELLLRAEHNTGGLYDELLDACAPLRAVVAPARERAAWASLLAELRV